MVRSRSSDRASENRARLCGPNLVMLGATLLLISQPTTALGQQQDDEPAAQGGLAVSTESTGPATTITGFRGLEWGTTEAEILGAFGEPFERRELQDGMRMLAYRSSLVGQPSVVLFGLLANENGGLVKVQEVIEVADGDACIEIIRDIHQEIDLQYPLIRPKEQAKNNTPDVICDAAPRGMAYWHRQWTDAETGSVITVSLASGSEHVDLIYESGRFRDWVDPESDRTTEVLEDEGAATEDALEAVP